MTYNVTLLSITPPSSTSPASYCYCTLSSSTPSPSSEEAAEREEMAARGRTSHRLSGGLIVSGLPESKSKPKPAMTSTPTPYTGGSIKNSGDLGKMFEMASPSSSNTTVDPVTNVVTVSTSSGPLTFVPSMSTPKKSPNSSSSGPLFSRGPFTSTPNKSTSSSSGSHSLPTTGLITSGPPSASSSIRRSGGHGFAADEPTPERRKKTYGSAVTVIGKGRGYEFGISTAAVFAGVLGLVILMTLGIFLLMAVKSIAVLGAACGILVLTVTIVVWNWVWREKGLQTLLIELPDTDLYGAASDQFVKVSGVVTCGSIPLETSYHRIPRCVYVSTELYEYRGRNGRQANPNHRVFTWGLRHSEKLVADFYISDSRRGIRALVKAGHGTKIASFVKPTNKIEINKANKDGHPMFNEWLENCGLSFDNRKMRVEEGYIKEGSTVTIIGILQRHDNILMIVPPEEPISTGCLWRRLLYNINIKGLVLIGDEKVDDEVITV